MQWIKAIKTNMTDRWRGAIMVGRSVAWKCTCPGFHATQEAAVTCARLEVRRQG